MTNNVIDMAVYNELKDAAGAEFVIELVAAFLEKALGMFADLCTVLDSADVDGFRRATHSLKSNADVFGAHALAATARRLELMEMSGSTPEIQAHLAHLDVEFIRTSETLKALQNG
ncbi:MAG: Hpt domain-containing protein [Sulfitobacter sp.]